MDEPGGHCWPFDRIQYFKSNFNNYTEKNNLEGMLYQYFEGIYYERYHRREKKIT
jgi:hypothetical protein